MKSKMIVAVPLGLLLAAALTACQGVKASTDNAEVRKDLRYGSDGKLTDRPDLTVPIWSSKGLKQKPEEITPVGK